MDNALTCCAGRSGSIPTIVGKALFYNLSAECQQQTHYQHKKKWSEFAYLKKMSNKNIKNKM